MVLGAQIRVVVVVGALYYIGAWIAWDVFDGVVFFPPAGITMAAGLLLSRRYLPAVVVAAMLGEALVDLAHDVDLAPAVGFAVANGIVPLIGVVVFSRLGGSVSLARHSDVLAFLLGCVVAAPLAGGMVGATVRVLDEGGHWPIYVAQWAAGDGIAVLVVTLPALLVPSAARDRRWRVQAAIAATAALVIVGSAMLTPLPLALFALPILLMAALRLGSAGVALTGSVIAITANLMTTRGHGAFADLDMTPDARLAWMQVSIATLISSSWWLSVELRLRLQVSQQREALLLDRATRVERTRVLEHALRPGDPISCESLEIDARYQPADVALGGDWHDTLRLPDGRIVFMVGDVVGHGLDAVGDMTQLRHACRTLLLDGHGLAETAEVLSRLTAETTRGRFATVALATFDPARSQCDLLLAGHPPPIMWAARNDEAVVLDVTPGPPLGLTVEQPYEQATVRLEPGDVIVLYTDGLIERPGHCLDIGIERLRNVLIRYHEASLGSLCQTIAAEVFPDAPQIDDVCVLAARCRVMADTASRSSTDESGDVVHLATSLLEPPHLNGEAARELRSHPDATHRRG